MSRWRSTLALCVAGWVGLAGFARAQPLANVSIVIFGPPSLGAFLPPVIKAQKLDEKNGLSITFVERTPDAYTAQFNSGEFQLGGSASLLTVGQADVRGVKVAYLFNLFDFWGAVVTSRPEVKTLRDLEGKELAAARGTTNFLMFDWFARQQGVDPAKLSVVNTATPGLVGYALADRADAVQLWEPAYTILLAKKPSLRTLDLQIAAKWTAFAGSRNIPYLGVAAHIDWIEKNRGTVPAAQGAARTGYPSRCDTRPRSSRAGPRPRQSCRSLKGKFQTPVSAGSNLACSATWSYSPGMTREFSDKVRLSRPDRRCFSENRTRRPGQ